MDINFEKTKHKTLAWCVEDWTSLFFINAFVREFSHYKDLNLIKKTTLEVIKNLLELELVVVGDLTNDNKFFPWEMPFEKILVKIKIDWDNLGRELYMYELVWFEITEKGRKKFEYLNSLPELKETNPFYFDDKNK